MAKYIGTYANSGDVQTALNEHELFRPFVAYTTDNNEVFYGTQGEGASVGDIVVYSTTDQLLHYIPQANYNTTSYPTTTYVPVGVVCMHEPDDIYSGKTGNVTFMGLYWLSVSAPDSGKTGIENIAWGYNGYDIPDLTNYATSGTAVTDMNGKVNTQAVLQYATAQTDWHTATAITWANEAGYYPIFECAWRYNTSGTVQGDWYIPAAGEIKQIPENLALFNSGLTLVNSSNLTGNYRLACSTEASTDKGWRIEGGSFKDYGKNQPGAFGGRPVCTKLMTRI